MKEEKKDISPELRRFSRAIARLRSKKGLSREELSDLIEDRYGETITTRTILNVESGRNATLKSLLLILDALLELESGGFLRSLSDSLSREIQDE